MNKYVILLIGALAAACETTAPEPCDMTVQLDDAPITLPLNGANRPTHGRE
jgi:hypothetical protein